MIHCKKQILAVLLLVFPLTLRSQAPVVDESENFAMTEEQAWGSPEGSSGFDHQKYESRRLQSSKG